MYSSSDLTDARLDTMIEAHAVNDNSTHYDGCETAWRHEGCAIKTLVTEIRQLRDERTELARALATAAQHERSRLVSVGHRRELADGWLDLARSRLPPPPTVDDMVGLLDAGLKTESSSTSIKK